MRDLYSVLGVARGASADEVKRAYRTLAKKLPPDVNPGDKAVEQRFKEASHAYAILSDPEKRRRYDAGEIDENGQERAAGFGAHGFGSGFARGGRRGGRAGGGERFDFAGGTIDLDDIFSDLFGGRGRSAGSGARSDDTYKLTVDFVEAARGGRQRIQLADGRPVEVTIPPGMEDGQKLRLKGQGAGGGDLYLEIGVRPHPYFRRTGRDVECDLPVSLPEAVLGASVPAPTLDGRVMLRIPPGANSGTRLRLKGKGIPARGAEPAGDLYCTLRVVLPEADESLRKFAQELQARAPYDPRPQ